MKDQRSSEIVITNGLTNFRYGKDEFHIDPEWDMKWLTYTDNIEKSSQMFAFGSKYRRQLMDSQLDFILWTENKIIFGSQNDIVIETKESKDVQKNVRNSLAKIREDLDEVMVFCS